MNKKDYLGDFLQVGNFQFQLNLNGSLLVGLVLKLAFFWGNEFDASKASAGSSESVGKLFEVGFFDSNAWGFYDMHGNVHEMTLGAYAYPETSITDPEVEPAADWWFFRRGGSFYQSGDECSSYFRNYQGWPRSDIGFRLALKKTN